MARHRLKTGYAKQLQQVAHDYQRSHGVDVLDLDEVVRWGRQTNRLQERPIDAHKRFKHDLARALALEYMKDPQGREVRRMHAVKIKEEDGQTRWEWADIKTAKPTHMRMSLQQQRTNILADCRQHKLIVESYNDNNIFGAQLELFDYNYNLDLEEESLGNQYPDENPDDTD